MPLEDSNLSDESLLSLLKSDDEKAFHLIFNKYHSFLCNSSYRIVQDKDAAKDVVQEVFMLFWNKRSESAIGNLKPYLHRAVINKSLKYIKKEQKNIWLEDSFDIPDPTAPVDLSNSNDLEEAITYAIASLSPGCRVVFTLSRYDALDNAEIADHLQISVKAVEKQITKSLKQLREMLKVYLT